MPTELHGRGEERKTKDKREKKKRKKKKKEKRVCFYKDTNYRLWLM